MSDRSGRSPAEHEQVDWLEKGLGKYTLVIAVSKRARDLKEQIHPLLQPTTGGLILRAINDLATGRARVRTPDPTPDD